jgi:hypothetical protein
VQETFTRELSAGTYYVRVLFNDDVGTAYRLRLESLPPPPPDDNSIESARDWGVINPGTVRAFDDYVGPDDRNDLTRITLAQPTRVYVKLSGLSDDADLMLLDATGNRIAYSKRSGSADEWFQIDLAAGTYYVRVLFVGLGATGTNYRLRIEGMAAQV